MPTGTYYTYDANDQWGTFRYTATIDVSSSTTYCDVLRGYTEYTKRECPECGSNDTDMIIAFGYEPPVFWNCNICGLKWNGNQVIL